MSSSLKSKSWDFGKDMNRQLLAAETGHKADIQTYYSGHLGPRSLDQNPPPKDIKQVIWKLSKSQEENPRKLAQTQRKGPTRVREKEEKKFTAGAALVEPEVSGSRKDLDTDYTPDANRRHLNQPKISYSRSNSLQVHPGALFHTKTKLPPILKKKTLLPSDHSHNESLNNEDQQKTKELCGGPMIARQDPWAGKKLAEIHERKLQKALEKLSANSWPHRDRLAVFSDVFDDVCESSPVFGRILREIKTDYDLYINHMMASQSHSEEPQTSLQDPGNDRLREKELEDAEIEVCRLEQEAREAVEENNRIRHELKNVSAITTPGDWDKSDATLSEQRESWTADGVRNKRRRVLDVWREIQQLEQEIKDKLVSTVTVTATERCINVLKTDIMRLIALNDRLKTTNKNLEDRINMILEKEKISKTARRLLWDEIRWNLQTE